MDPLRREVDGQTEGGRMQDKSRKKDKRDKDRKQTLGQQLRKQDIRNKTDGRGQRRPYLQPNLKFKTETEHFKEPKTRGKSKV